MARRFRVWDASTAEPDGVIFLPCLFVDAAVNVAPAACAGSEMQRLALGAARHTFLPAAEAQALEQRMARSVAELNGDGS